MNPTDNNNPNDTQRLSRTNSPFGQGIGPTANPAGVNQTNLAQGSAPVQNVPGAGQFIPYGAFPANMPREYDPNIKQIVEDLVNRKYRPSYYLSIYPQRSAQDPVNFPPLDENTINLIKSQGPDISEEAFKFEVARVYNKLEIEIYQLAISQLPPDKQQELNAFAEQNQNNPASQMDVIMKIREFMQLHVPNIALIVDQYMRGFMKQYMAGRY